MCRWRRPWAMPLWRRRYQAGLRRCGSWWPECPSIDLAAGIIASGKAVRVAPGAGPPQQAFQFDPGPKRLLTAVHQCIAAKGSRGRHVLEPCCSRPERCSKALTMYEYRVRRVVVEHRLARLVQLGIRQSRYFARCSRRDLQLYLAATVNLTLVAGKLGWSGCTIASSRQYCPRNMTTVVRDPAHVGFTAQIPLLASPTRVQPQ